MRYRWIVCIAAALFGAAPFFLSGALALESDGLIAAYPMNSGDGEEVVDISDNEYHGTLLNGAGWYKGAGRPQRRRGG